MQRPRKFFLFALIVYSSTVFGTSAQARQGGWDRGGGQDSSWSRCDYLQVTEVWSTFLHSYPHMKHRDDFSPEHQFLLMTLIMDICTGSKVK